MLDVLIQTHNEELNLPYALRSVAGWVNKVFVVDSGSTDRTARIATEAGAQFVHHDWEGYAAQKNWALDNLPFESDWILILDADESVTPELRDEILQVTHRPAEQTNEAGFLLNRVLIFLGTHIYHCGYFPSWNLRLFKRGKARYEERLVHEHMLVNGPTGEMKNLLHHQDRRGLEHFFAKHNRYSTLEAREILEHPQSWPGLATFRDDRVVRRRYLKSTVLPRMPLSWMMRFIWMYFIQLGFLDGKAGWKLSQFISTYEFLIKIKYQELKRLRDMGLLSGDTRQALSQPEGEISWNVETGLPAPKTPNVALAVGLTISDAPSPDTYQVDAAQLDATRVGTVTRTEGGATLDIRSPKVASVIASKPTTAAGSSMLVNDEKLRQIAANSVGRLVEPMGPNVKRRGKTHVSVMIPTLNEEANMARCLDHLQWADEVVVVDSGSTDRTVEIAHAYGCKVIDFDWNGQWPKKKNWALRNVEFENEWVLIVDADEWIMPELAEEIARSIADTARVGFYVNRRFIFMGQWIKHCGYYPSWNLRLIKRGKGEYEQLTGVGNTGSGDNEVHEHVVPAGEVTYLQNDMLHFAFPSIHTFMEKHNRYSNWEAAVQFRSAEGESDSQSIGRELSKRRRLKNLSRKLPFRSTLRFLYSYIWTGGFLDGKPGYVFCRLLAIYEYLSVAKYTELRRAEEDRKQARSLSSVRETDWRSVRDHAERTPTLTLPPIVPDSTVDSPPVAR